MTSASNQGDASRRRGSSPGPANAAPADVAAMRARLAALDAEVSRLHEAEQIARQREQQLSTHNLVLVNLSRSAAIEEGDLEAAFQQITVAAAHTLDVERASIWVFNENRSAIKCLDLYERSHDRHGNGLELKAADFPSYFRAIEDNRTLAAEDARTDPRTCEFDATYLRPLGITSMLDAPVRRGGRLVGVICHEQVGRACIWSLEDQAFAGSMADFVSMTLQAGERADALRVARAGEHQLRLIIDLVPHMILAKDGRGHILLANKAVAEAYGGSVDQILGRSHWDVHPLRDEVAAMLSDDLQVIETGRERFTAEERFTDARGNRRILQTTRIPFMFSASREPAVLGVSIDITQRKQDEHAREMMIQELDHRVKNNLAVVIALAEHTCRTAPSLPAFSDSFGGRLRAMAISHELLARARWEGADLRAMAERIVEPYQIEHTAGSKQSEGPRGSGGPRDGEVSGRVSIEGDPLRLLSTIAPNICMILHELATNAAKHGALSSAKGRVVLSWYREMRAEDDRRTPWLHIEWIERGGPAVKLPTEPKAGGGGFGTAFIGETTRYQLRGHANLQFEANGLHCTIDIPLERPIAPRADQSIPINQASLTLGGAHLRHHAGPERVGAAGPGQENGATHPRRVLVVEDDLLVAKSIGSHLESFGCEVIGPAATSDDACALLKSKPVDAAILDINLSAGTSAPVARALAGKSTPFVFVTGYSNLKTLPDDLRGQRVLCKPIDRESLARALREMAGV